MVPSPSLALARPAVNTERARSSPGFAALDDRLRAAGPGVIEIVATRDACVGLAEHVSRRLARAGAPCIIAPSFLRTPVAAFFARKLGLDATSSVPWILGRAIAKAAHAARCALVVPPPRAANRSAWDAEVLSRIEESGDVIVVRLYASEDARHFERGSADAPVYDVEDPLDGDALARWWSAIAEDAARSIPHRRIADLGEWWRAAVKQQRDDAGGALAWGSSGPALADARSRLALAGVPLPSSMFEPHVVDALVVSRIARADGDDLELLGEPALDVDAHPRAPEMLRSVAQSMADGRATCAWSQVRAAELFLEAGDMAAAERALVTALGLVDDPLAVREIHAAWFDAVERAPREHLQELAIHAAKRALKAGEPEEALRWTDRAAASAPGSHEIALQRGRALLLLGDFTIARVATEQALARAESNDERAEATTLLAELAYVEGKHDLALDLVARALELAGGIATTLDARNVTGKVLLARGAWDEADAHFAAEAMIARDHGETEAELRARVNRAIAIMSRGDLTAARSLLEATLDAAVRDPIAAVCVRRNLAVVAHQQGDYATAMKLWDEALRYPTATGGRASAARMIANLADLRLRLGLFEQAEHTLAFGRRAVTNPTGATASHLSVVEARLAIARGDATRANRLASLAMQQAEAAGDRGDRLPDACLTAARAALLDGAVERARELQKRASELASNDVARAEAAILAALIARAAGEPHLDLARSASAIVREYERELAIEAHALVVLAARDAGDLPLAERHCANALAIRDTIAASLPADMRASMLAMPSSVELSQLAASICTKTSVAPAPSSSNAESGVLASPKRKIVGAHSEIRNLVHGIRKAARTTATVLIRGESGTGKELVASALHEWSDRARGPLVSVNCAALSDTLLSSELFGHEKGAFTGAHAKKQGRFELAHGGTLFLDEIGDICPKTQVALLRVLQEKTFERVGGGTPIRVDVRVVCATHRDLEAMVERGEFRRDLYYRLSGLALEVPPLRRRLSDLPALAEHLLDQIARERSESPRTITPAAYELLVRHAWPGNVRELENVLRAVTVFADRPSLDVEDFVAHCEPLRMIARDPQHGSRDPQTSLPPAARAASPAERPIELLDPADIAYAHVRNGASSLSGLKKQIERECIVRALRETNGNISRAAILLGIKRPRLSQIVKEYALTAAIAPEQDEP